MAMFTTQFDQTTLNILKTVKVFAKAAFMLFKEEWPNIIVKEKAEFVTEKRMDYEGDGGLPEKDEGAAAETTELKEGYIETVVMKEYAFDMPVTSKQRQFASANSKFLKQMGDFLSRSAKVAYENVGVAPLNNGFNTSFTGGDGLTYFNAAHTFKFGGTASNVLTAADLSKTTLEDGLKTVVQSTMENSIPAAKRPSKICSGTDNIFVLPELMKSTLDPESANNTYNALQEFPMGKFISHYQTDTDQWTIDTDTPTRVLYEAVPPTADEYMADKERTLVLTMDTTIASGFHNPLGSYGNQGS